MQQHIKTLAWLNIVLGGLGVLASLAVLGGALAVSSLVGLGGDDAVLTSHIVALIGGLIAAFTLLLSVPALVLGYGLLNLCPWARILGLVLAALGLFHVPVGTALALYTFWVLLKPETEALFHRY
jgi:hypothetical protein